MTDLYSSIVDLVQSLLSVAASLGMLLLWWWLLLFWVAWWLWGVNWAKAWRVLAQGAWVPVLLLVVLGALVWSQILPRPLTVGAVVLPNFWWQLTATLLLAGTALFCGWLQGYMGWTPEEVPVYPEGGHHGHGHGDGHGHGHH